MAYHFGRIHKKPHNLVPKWHFNSSRRQITGSCSSSSETEVAASTSDFRYVGFAQMKEKVGWNPVRVCIIWTTCYWFSIMVTLIRWSIINCFESKDVMRLSQLVNQQKGLFFFFFFFFSYDQTVESLDARFARELFVVSSLTTWLYQNYCEERVKE